MRQHILIAFAICGLFSANPANATSFDSRGDQLIRVQCQYNGSAGVQTSIDWFVTGRELSSNSLEFERVHERTVWSIGPYAFVDLTFPFRMRYDSNSLEVRLQGSDNLLLDLPDQNQRFTAPNAIPGSCSVSYHTDVCRILNDDRWVMNSQRSLTKTNFTAYFNNLEAEISNLRSRLQNFQDRGEIRSHVISVKANRENNLANVIANLRDVNQRINQIKNRLEDNISSDLRRRLNRELRDLEYRKADLQDRRAELRGMIWKIGIELDKINASLGAWKNFCKQSYLSVHKPSGKCQNFGRIRSSLDARLPLFNSVTRKVMDRNRCR